MATPIHAVNNSELLGRLAANDIIVAAPDYPNFVNEDPVITPF